MKKYSILIISFIVTVCIFVVLLFIEKQDEYNNQLVVGYVLKDNIMQYESICLDKLEPIYLNNDSSNMTVIFNNIGEIDKYLTNSNMMKGSIVYKENLVLKSDLKDYLKDSKTEKVVIPISNIDSVISNIINSNVYVNVYIQIGNNLKPENIKKYKYITMDDSILVLYLEHIKPVCYLDNNGNKVNNNSIIKSIVVETSAEDALYLNYIKGKAGFNITVI
ncbi:MAG: hypothetical protein PHH22_01035 [Clostridia bacterium]|nr:hypothetical protein [Clostridia bacterium]